MGPASAVAADVDVLHTVAEWGNYDTEQAAAPDGRVRAVCLLPTPVGTCAALASDTAARQEGPARSGYWLGRGREVPRPRTR
jgi:hypothetical protein